MGAKDNLFYTQQSINIGGRLLDLSTPRVMGILNITPDSFHDGGQHNTVENALKKAGQMLDDGADILDIGAFSTRPGAADISLAEELNRLEPILKAISLAYPAAILSVDTFRAEVARKAIGLGAHIINDVSGGTLDVDMFKTVAELQVPYILMHMRGTPQTMQQLTTYENVVADVLKDLAFKVAALRKLGVNDVIIDPGFGFAKTLEQNYQLLHQLSDLRMLGLPLLVGVSRKSMVTKTLNLKAADALNGTTALNAFALDRGAAILRVHDVKEAKQVITLHQYLNS